MKRTIFRISLVMLLGVVTSVAVAWGCAIWAPMGLNAQRNPPTHWLGDVPSHWPPPSAYHTHLAFGLRVRLQMDLKDDRMDGVFYQTLRTGWPFQSMMCRFWNEIRDKKSNARTEGQYLISGTSRVLPLMPILPGLLANTAIYGGVWWAMLFGPGMVIRWRRRCAGRCTKCGYDLRGLSPDSDGTCSECGEEQ